MTITEQIISLSERKKLITADLILLHEKALREDEIKEGFLINYIQLIGRLSEIKKSIKELENLL